MDNVDPKKKKPFYKRWWFILIAIVFVIGAIGNIFDSDETKQEQGEEKVDVEDKKKEKDEKPDMNLEIEVKETIMNDDEVIVRGTTNIIDGAILEYQLRATMGETEIVDGKWEIVESTDTLEKDDEDGFYGDGTEYQLLILFPSFGSTANQPEHVQKAYGDYGEKIKKGPNLLESDGSKYVSLDIEFDTNGIIDPEEKNANEFEQAIKEWEDFYKEDMLEHYSEAGIIDIRETSSDWDVVYVYVPNEFKMSTEGERQYYVEEVGPLLEADLTSHFKKDHDIHVYFKYEDGNDMATRKMFGGWKIK